MTIRQAVIGEVALHDGARVDGVDLGALVRRLLLFDTVVVKSIRLRDLPFLARAFGYDGLLQLLNSGIMKFCCEFTTLATDFHRDGLRSVPKGHFHFGVVDAYDRDAVLRSELLGLQSVTGLKNPERASLEETVWKCLIRPPSPASYGKEIMTQVEADLRASAPVLRAAILEQMKQTSGTTESAASALLVRVEETTERVFLIRLSAEQVHPLLSRSVTAVANLNQRMAEMQAYSAITGFSDDDVQLLYAKLTGVLARLNPRLAEEQFERAVEIAGLPAFRSAKRVSVDRLLQVRDSAQCRDFRKWLSTLQEVSDSDIRSMVAGFKDRCTILASPDETTVRFAAFKNVGLLSEGLLATVIDSFVADTVLPTSGIVAFLTKTYPSLFVSP
jgi:hypothetical protein